MRDDSQGNSMSQDQNQDDYSQQQGSYGIEEHAQQEEFDFYDGILAQDPDQYFHPWQDSPDLDAPTQVEPASQNLSSNASTQIGVHNPLNRPSWELSLGSTQSYNHIGPQLTESKSESKADIPLIQEKNGPIQAETAMGVHPVQAARQQVTDPQIAQAREVPEKVDAPAMNTRGRKRDSDQISPDEQRQQNQITNSSSSSKPNPNHYPTALDFMADNSQDSSSYRK